MRRKSRDNISNGRGVIVLTNNQSNKQTVTLQTDTPENNTSSLLYAAGGNNGVGRRIEHSKDHI